MEFTKLIEDVLVKSKPVRPNCSVCGGIMQAAEWDSSGRELLVCGSIKPNNQRGDTRVYDPHHYEKSKVRIAINIDMALIRRHLAEAFGRVEAETESRVNNENRNQKPAVESKAEVKVTESKLAVEAKPAVEVTGPKKKAGATV